MLVYHSYTKGSMATDKGIVFVNTNVIFDVVILLWIISEIALARLKRSGAEASEKDKFSLRVLWTSIVLGITAGVMLSIYHIGAMREENAGVVLIGFALIVIGLVIRWIAILTLWKYFTVDVAIAEDHKLVTFGLYRIVRHPSYTGSLLSFLGLGLVFSNWYSILVIVIPITAAFMYRIKIEESALAAFFGDSYREYSARTKRLIPGIF